jgi:hypothetical protein
MDMVVREPRANSGRPFETISAHPPPVRWNPQRLLREGIAIAYQLTPLTVLDRFLANRDGSRI